MRSIGGARRIALGILGLLGGLPGQAEFDRLYAGALEIHRAGELDAVLFSYSLTMAPSVGVALDRAVRDLRPGGWLGAVDFLSTVGPVGRSLLGRYPLEMGTHLRDAVASRIAEPTLSIERRSWCGLWRWFLLGGRV